jgi:hypothetical protein
LIAHIARANNALICRQSLRIQKWIPPSTHVTLRSTSHRSYRVLRSVVPSMHVNARNRNTALFAAHSRPPRPSCYTNSNLVFCIRNPYSHDYLLLDMHTAMDSFLISIGRRTAVCRVSSDTAARESQLRQGCDDFEDICMLIQFIFPRTTSFSIWRMKFLLSMSMWRWFEKSTEVAFRSVGLFTFTTLD